MSVEAIFLSTFVLIGQNRQSELQQVKADHEFHAEEQELHINSALTRQIHELTQELNRHISADPPMTRRRVNASMQRLRDSQTMSDDIQF